MTIDYKLKPASPYRSTLSPSSFYNIRCPRCLWLEYWHNFKFPVNLSLQLKLSRIQEAAYDGVPSTLITSAIPTGQVAKYKTRLTSRPVSINGEVTRWKIHGEIDLLVDHEDGTYSVIDGKVSMKADADAIVDAYWTQLEAYVFAFENPEFGEPKPIKTIGLLQWKIEDSLHLEGNQRGFSVGHRYIPVERRPQEFQDFLTEFISIIEGEFPSSGEQCENCKFLNKIGFSF